MSGFIEKYRKLIFYIILGCTFLCILAYNVLTPFLSDDIAYICEIRDNASDLGGVFRLAYAELFEHGGRILHYVTFRLFFYIGNKQVFNVIASFMFVVLGLSVYANIEKKKKYDITVLLLSYLLIWLSAICFGETILWVAGAVGYLFATTYILLSLALYKRLLNSSRIKHPVLMTVLMFLIALLAGNSSENNSGAAILLVIIFTVNKFISLRKANDNRLKIKDFIKPYMIAAYAGYFIGFLLLVLAPGAHNRASVRAEGDYTGIVGILSHVYKLSVSLREYFTPAFIAIIILIVILAVTGHFRSFKDVRENNAILFIFGMFASTYTLALISIPMKRVFFGASLFLMIALIELMMQLKQNEIWAKIIRYSFVSILCMMFFFTYLENLVNLARILREDNERAAIIEQAVSDGLQYVEVPKYREDFRNRYSTAHDNDMDEDSGYWINLFYEDWYGIDRIVAIPRDEWNEKYG